MASCLGNRRCHSKMWHSSIFTAVGVNDYADTKNSSLWHYFVGLPNNLVLNLHWYLFTKGEDTIDGYCVVGYFGLPLHLSSGASTNTQTRPSFASCSISLSSMKLFYSSYSSSPRLFIIIFISANSFMVILGDWVEGSWQLQLTTFHFKVTPTKTLKRLWPLKPSKAISPLHTDISSGWAQIRRHSGRYRFQFVLLIL